MPSMPPIFAGKMSITTTMMPRDAAIAMREARI